MHIGFESDTYNIAHNITQIRSGSCLIHAHTMYEILYFIEGDAIFSLGGTEYRMEPHTLLLIPPNVFHGIHVLTEQPYHRYTVHFDPSVLAHEYRAFLLSRLPAKFDSSCCMKNMQHSGILDMLHQFDDLSAAPEALRAPLVPIYLQALIARVLTILPENPSDSAYKKYFGCSPNHDKWDAGQHGKKSDIPAEQAFLVDGFTGTLNEKSAQSKPHDTKKE